MTIKPRPPELVLEIKKGVEHQRCHNVIFVECLHLAQSQNLSYVQALELTVIKQAEQITTYQNEEMRRLQQAATPYDTNFDPNFDPNWPNYIQ